MPDFLTAKFKTPRVDLLKYREALKETLADAITRAAFEWIIAVSDAVPSWSGASRATMQHLASRAGFQVEIAISSTAPEDRTSLGLANAKGDILTDQADQGKVSFFYSTTLAHLIWNEFNNANIVRDRTKWRNVELIHPGPYHFQEKGAKAVQQVFRGVRLPSPSQFIVSSSLRV